MRSGLPRADEGGGHGTEGGREQWSLQIGQYAGMADDRFEAQTFECVHCSARTQARWGTPYANLKVLVGAGANMEEMGRWSVSQCTHCNQYSLWLDENLAWPSQVMVGPAPHSDMPSEVSTLYNEARLVAANSRRSAVALLRLGLQVLIDGLVPGNKRLDEKIGVLVLQGLHPQAQQAMDVLRVIGNNAVHPGVIDLDQDEDLVPSLFALLNLIVEQVIERPKQIANLYDNLPAGAREAVARRDESES
jgi:hypothetical protein